MKQTNAADGIDESAPSLSDVLSADAGGESLDRLFRVLADERRRRALHHLDRSDEAVAKAELATSAAASAKSERPAALSREERRRAELELHHTHLPHLRDAGLVDVGDGAVSLTAAGRRAQTWLTATTDAPVQ